MIATNYCKFNDKMIVLCFHETPIISCSCFVNTQFNEEKMEEDPESHSDAPKLSARAAKNKLTSQEKKKLRKKNQGLKKKRGK